MIYLDNNATTNVFPEILEKTSSLQKENPYLNPSSIHGYGKRAKKILENAKLQILNSLNAKCHDIYFTSSATESINMAILGTKNDMVFTAKTEHDAVLQSALKATQHEFIDNDPFGRPNINHLEERIKKFGKENFLCSFSLANNESGVLTEISQIADLIHNYGGVLHCDASQFIGKEKFDFSKINADLISFSGHKIHAGHGSGVLICQSGMEIFPLIVGGGQQNYKRAGTENIPAIFALGQAVSIVNEDHYLREYKKHTLALRDFLDREITQDGGDVFGVNVPRISNTSLIGMKNVNNFVQLIEFDLQNFCLSAGSACSSGRTTVSHVLKACGLLEEKAKNFIRVSTGLLNTSTEIEKFISVWKILNSK
jgi:cysteine desulfurase